MNAHQAARAAAIALLATVIMIPATAAIIVTREAGSGVAILSNMPVRTGAGIVAKPIELSRHRSRNVITDDGASSASAVAFPRIAPNVQRERDGGRKQILRDELDAELLALQSARERGEAADAVHRHDSNIAALKRELAGLRE